MTKDMNDRGRLCRFRIARARLWLGITLGLSLVSGLALDLKAPGAVEPDDEAGEWAHAERLAVLRERFETETAQALANAELAQPLRMGDTTYVSGLLTGLHVWDEAGSPYVIESDLLVGLGAMLRILPGTRILLGQDVLFLVLGNLTAIGAENDSIYFEPLGLPRWRRIGFNNSWGNTLSYCSLRHLASGLDHEGSIYAYDSSRVTVTDSQIRDGLGGGCVAFNRCNITVIGSMIHDVSGLALSSFDRSRPHFEGNLVWDTGNDCVDSDYNPAPPKLVRANTLWDCGNDGIDLDFGFNGDIIGNTVFGCADKALSISFSSTPFVQNNIFAFSDNGVVVSNSSVAELVNNTMANNTKFGVKAYIRNEGYGGGTASLLNCIVFNNYHGLYSFSIEDSSEITATYSCIEGDTTFAGVGNISADPMFADPLSWDFHLTEGSSCIDAAQWVFPVTSYDFEGHARWDNPLVPNTGSGSITYVDIGADEFWYEGASVEDPGEAAGVSRVIQAVRISPLPARRQLSMSIQLARPATMRIDFYDVRGRRLDALVREGQSGWNPVEWDPEGLAGRGVIFYRVRAEGESSTGHAVVLH